MPTVKWSDLSTYGRYIKRTLTLLMNEVKAEEAKLASNPGTYRLEDVDRIINITNTFSKASLALAKLTDVADHDKRLNDIQKIIENIPPDVLLEAKQRIGN